MATVAELRMDVDSRPVKNAGRDLDQLASKAEKTERATNKLGDGSKKASRGVADLAHETRNAGQNIGGMEGAIGKVIGRLAAFTAGILSVTAAIRGIGAGLEAADNFRALDNRIRLVTDSAEEFKQVQSGLIDISRRTFSSIEGTVQAYQRMAGATDRLGISQSRLLSVAETVNKAVALSGATSQAAEASLIQFGQALSNNFQASAQEINSLNEQVFALSDAIARGITKVTGVETFRSDLKRMAEDGKLSSELVIRALEAVKEETDATFDNLDRTFAQVAQRLKTNSQIIAKEAFGPLLNIKIDFYTKVAKALEDPRTIQAAQRFGATLVDIARGFERNAGAILKTVQGIAAALATLAGASVIGAVVRGLASLGGVIAGLRAGVIALNASIVANPLGALATAIAATVGLVVTFRDQITRSLTPFKSFKELAEEVGPEIRSAFEGVSEAVSKVVENVGGAIAAFGKITGLTGVIENLGGGWGLVEKAITASATALAIYLGLNLANALATTLNLAGAWRTVEKAIKGAAGVQVLLSGAGLSGLATGVGRLSASWLGYAANVGKAVFSVAGLRAALAGLGAVISSIPLAGWIIGGVTALVTFRKEISNVVTGTRDAGIGINAVFKVLQDRIESLRKTYAERLSGFGEWVISVRAEGAEVVEKVLERIRNGIESAREAFSSLIPQGVKDKAAELASAIGGIVSVIRSVAAEAAKMADGLVSAFDSAAKKIREIFAGALEWIADKLEAVARFAASTPIGIKLKTDAEDFRNFIRDVREEASRQEIVVRGKILFENGLENFKKQFGDAPIGIFVDPSVPEAQNAFKGLNAEIEAFIKNGGVAKNASRDLTSGLGDAAKSVKQTLIEQVALAQRLADAAKGGQDNYDAAKKAIELDAIAADAVKRAAEAGESLTFETARFLVGKIDDFEKSRDAFLEADKRLKDSISKTRDNIFQSLNSRIDAFASDISGVNFNYMSTFDAEKIAEDFGRRLQQILQDVEIDSIGIIDDEQLGELERKVKQLAPIFYDALKRGGLNVSDEIWRALENGGDDLADKIGVSITRAVGEIANIVDGVFGTANRLADIISDKSLKTIEKVTGVMRTLGDKAQRFGENLGGPVGDVIKTGGTILKAVSSVIDFVKNIFSKPSNEAAAVNFKLDTGTVVDAFSKKDNAENIAARDALKDATTSITQALKELTGGNFGGKGIVINVGKRENVVTSAGQSITTPAGDNEAALQAAITLLLKNLRGGEAALVNFAKKAFASGQSIEDVISVLEVLKQASDTGQKALSNYALAMAKAGRSADTIAENVNKLSAISALAEPKLSEIASSLKQIDDAVNPVIEDLKSLGLSFSGVAKVGKDAAAALGENFIQGVRDLNIDLQNSTFGQFNKLLEEIRQREEDAQLLLNRGAITKQQFAFVQSTGGLQVSKFFQGLSDDDKASLADYLGLLKTASGDIAVARVKLEEQFSYLIDNVEETAKGFEEAARTFERLTQNLQQTADSIRTEFSGLTPKADVQTLQGRVTTLLETVRDDTATTQSRQSALEALPQVVTQLVQKAREAFGGTEQFAQIRDFGLASLDEAASISDQLAKQNQAQADAAREDVKILTDIRELLNDDRQLVTLQNILDEGRITNSLIAQQIQSFLTLMSTAGSNLNDITAEQLQSAAADYLAKQQQQIAAQTVASSSSTAPASTTAAQTSSLTNEQIVQIIADNATANSRLAASNNAVADKIDDLSTEVRRLVARL